MNILALTLHPLRKLLQRQWFDGLYSEIKKEFYAERLVWNGKLGVLPITFLCSILSHIVTVVKSVRFHITLTPFK